MNILALDCATKTGYATLINGSIRSGVFNTRERTNESAGMKYIRFDAWLVEMHRLGNFSLICYEKPHHLQGTAIESMNGFITGIHRFVARRQWVEYKAESLTTIKKFATGSGKSGKGEMMAYFRRETRREPIDDNEADAYALLRFVMAELGVEAKG